MSIKTFFKRYWRVFCSSLICIAVISMFVPCLSYATSTITADYLDSLGLGGFGDFVDSEGDIISSLTQAITGMSSDEVTAEYYNQYYEFLQGDWWGLASGSGGIYDSTNNFNDSYLEAMGMQYAMYNTVRPFDWDSFVLYAKARRAAELLESGSFDSDSYFHDNPQSSINISSSGLKNIYSDYATRYMPMPTVNEFKWSYQSDTSYDQTDYSSMHQYDFYPDVPVYLSNRSWAGKAWSDFYALPFYYDDDNSVGTFYGTYYFHIYAKNLDGTVYIYLDTYDLSDNTLDRSYSSTWDVSTYPILGLYGKNNYSIRAYSSSAKYYSSSFSTLFVFASPSITSLDYSVTSQLGTLIGAPSFTPNSNKNDDWGFLCQNTPFELVANQTSIDFDKVPDNYVITIEGDTIYNYPITNPETGESSTINYYITNNYTLPENSTDDPADNGGSSSGGSTSGTVNVAGEVVVGGQIDIKSDPIDINVNVNTGSSSDITSSEGVQFDQDVSLNNYYDWMNEQTSGFSGFMKEFFNWLPADILIMICAGFGLVILARFLGR